MAARSRPSAHNTIVEYVIPVQNMTVLSLLLRDIHRIREDTDSTIEWLPGLRLLKNGMQCRYALRSAHETFSRSSVVLLQNLQEIQKYSNRFVLRRCTSDVDSNSADDIFMG